MSSVDLCGVTTECTALTLGDVTYIDTPGVNDPFDGHEKATAIKNQLNPGGKFVIMFVFNVDKGRLAGEDAMLLKTFLEAVQGTKPQYYCIFNRDPGLEQAKIQICFASMCAKKSIPAPLGYFFMPIIADATGATDHVISNNANVVALKTFVHSAFPQDIAPHSIGDFDISTLHRQITDLNKELAALQLQIDKQAEKDRLWGCVVSKAAGVGGGDLQDLLSAVSTYSSTVYGNGKSAVIRHLDSDSAIYSEHHVLSGIHIFVDCRGGSLRTARRLYENWAFYGRQDGDTAYF
ncbi:hypothetical protein Pelo_583 [Pelomyxa schiedti]|nr:hypothetical protein Pelo_583 [Pelomyxa schiedti]